MDFSNSSKKKLKAVKTPAKIKKHKNKFKSKTKVNRSRNFKKRTLQTLRQKILTIENPRKKKRWVRLASKNLRTRLRFFLIRRVFRRLPKSMTDGARRRFHRFIIKIKYIRKLIRNALRPSRILKKRSRLCYIRSHIRRIRVRLRKRRVQRLYRNKRRPTMVIPTPASPSSRTKKEKTGSGDLIHHSQKHIILEAYFLTIKQTWNNMFMWVSTCKD